MNWHSRYMTEIDRITPEHVETFLHNYRKEVLNVPDYARQWPTLDHEESLHYAQDFEQAMGDRYVLGLLHQAGRLSPGQERLMAWTDRLLMSYAGLIADLFEFDVFSGHFELLYEAEDTEKAKAAKIVPLPAS